MWQIPIYYSGGLGWGSGNCRRYTIVRKRFANQLSDGELIVIHIEVRHRFLLIRGILNDMGTSDCTRLLMVLESCQYI